jgi:hypothetical protein
VVERALGGADYMINYSLLEEKSKWLQAAGGGVPSTDLQEVEGGTGQLERVLIEDPLEGWNTKIAKSELTDAWAEWATGFAQWKSFITLTFKNEKTPDVALSLFKWWLKINNQYTFGKRYTRKVGHSYFSYLVGAERQKRDVLHFHVLVDKPINYELTHNAWGDRCGFAWIDGNLTDRKKVVNYVCKYVMKGGEVDLFKAKKDYFPQPTPAWWKEKEGYALSRVGLACGSQAQLAEPLTSWVGEKQARLSFG